MNQADRICMIIEECNINQKILADELGVSKSYVSRLCKEPGLTMSSTLLNLLKETRGYSPLWVAEGIEPKMVEESVLDDHEDLAELKKEIINEISTLTDKEVELVLLYLQHLKATTK